MAYTHTLQPSLDDLFSSSATSTSSATLLTHSHHPSSHLPPPASLPPANPPTYSRSPHSSSPSPSLSSAATTLSPAALHSLITTKQRELSDITSLQSTALTSHLASLTQSYQSLRAHYTSLKHDFLYNLNLLNERDAELTQWEADDQVRQRREEERERECVALRSEVKVRHVKDKERVEEERQRRVELTASHETKLAVLSEELGKLRVAVEEERAKGDRRVEAVREEAERERREVQRMYEARLEEEQRARMEDKETLADTIDHSSRDRRRADEVLHTLAAERDEQHKQLSTLQAERKEFDRLCHNLRHALAQSQEKVAVLQQQLSEVHDSSDTRYSQLLRERDDALEEWKAGVVRAEEERVEREKERAEEAERRRVALAAERQREEERAADWRRRLEEKVEEAEAERRERRKVEYEAVMTRQQAEAEREALEERLDELQQDDERKEQEWKREVWRLTEEVKERRDRMERMQKEKEQRREELMRLKAAVEEYKEREDQWTRDKNDRQRLTNELDEERRRSQELEEEVIRSRVELQRRREAESARGTFAVHVTDEHGQQRHQHRSQKPNRPSSISTTTHAHSLHSQQLNNDYSPAFSDDLGPVSLPSSQTNSPRATATSAASSSTVEQLQAENVSLRTVIDTMRTEMVRVVNDVEARDEHERQEVERLRHECERAAQERAEWRLERERLLDISNRLKAELRRKPTATVASHEEKEQLVEERVVGSNVVDWPVSAENRRSAVGDIDRVRQALNGLIHSNQQLSDNIKALTVVPHTPHTVTHPVPVVTHSPPLSSRNKVPSHPPSAPSVSAPHVSSSFLLQSRHFVPVTLSAVGTALSDLSSTATASATSAPPRPTSPAANRAAHRRSSALRRLKTAELALSSAAALNAEVERISPRSGEQSPRPSTPPATTVVAAHSPPRDKLLLSGKRAALISRESERREATGRDSTGVVDGQQVNVNVKKGRMVVSPVRSRMNLTGKVRNYAVGP